MKYWAGMSQFDSFECLLKWNAVNMVENQIFKYKFGQMTAECWCKLMSSSSGVCDRPRREWLLRPCNWIVFKRRSYKLQHPWQTDVLAHLPGLIFALFRYATVVYRCRSPWIPSRLSDPYDTLNATCPNIYLQPFKSSISSRKTKKRYIIIVVAVNNWTIHETMEKDIWINFHKTQHTVVLVSTVNYLHSCQSN